MNAEKSLKFVQFGPFVFSFEERALRRRGAIVALRPRALRLLEFLLLNQGRLVTFDEIQQLLWGNQVVEWRNGIHQVVKEVRAALEDDGTLLANQPRRGYVFHLPEPVQEREVIKIGYPVAFLLGFISLPLALVGYCLSVI